MNIFRARRHTDEPKQLDCFPRCLFKLTAVASIILANTFILTSLYANPQGGSVVGGQANISSPQANTVVVTQSSERAAIDWQTFNIATHEKVNVQQPSTHSILLNRVNPQNGASDIFGSLTANGQIWIINPAGILFGPTAHINVGGLLATTADISNHDFMNGNYHFVQSPDWNGGIVNQGHITVRDTGLAALVAPGVENQGVIRAKMGTVVLAASKEFTIDFYGDQLINFGVAVENSPGIDPRTHQLMHSAVSNSGKIIADGGTVILSAQAAKGVLDHAINMSGYIQANTVSQKGGTIILSAGQNGVVNVSGTISASGRRKGQLGGTIQIVGNAIRLTGHATINATGQSGGGEVLIGGYAHGGEPELNADYTYISPYASINVSALTSGNGGSIVVRSNQDTQVYGTLLARGGSQNGNGGLIETSGDYLDVNGITINTSARNGQLGSWLLDPTNIWIASSLANAQTAGDPTNDQSASTGSGGNPNTFAATNAVTDSFLSTVTLNAALASANVVVTTTNANGTSPTGNITVVNAITWASTNSLTLTAANNIAIDAAITTGAAGSQLILNAAGNVTQLAAGLIKGSGSLVQEGAGTVTLSQANTYTGSTTIQSGTISLTTAKGIQNSSSLTVDSGATFNISGVVVTAAESPTTFNLNGTGVGGNGALTGNGTASYAGAITLATNSTIAVASGNTLTLSGAIGGSGSLTMAGPGTLALTGTNNSYSGGTVLQGGTVSIAADLSLGAAPGSVNAASITFNGGTLASTATLTLNANRGITLTGNGTLSPATGTTLNYAGIITGSGSLTMSGAGTLSLTGVNTYTGNTQFNAGTLSIAADSGLGSDPNSFSATNLTFNGGTLASTANVNLNTNRGVTLTGAGTLAPATSTTLTVNGVITGSGLLTMNGAGTLALPATNTNTGGVTINNANGTVSATNVNALGTSGTITVTAGTLSLNLGGATLTNTSTINLNGAGVSSEGALFEAGTSGTDNLNNPINLASATGIGIATGGTLELGASGNPIISGTGALTINQSGTSGALMINSTANTYTGTTTIDAGTVTIATLTSLSTTSSLGAPTTAANGTITLGSNGSAATLIDTDSSATPSSNRRINTAGTGGSGLFEWTGTGALSLTGTVSNAGTSGLTFETTNTGTLALATGAITNTNGLTFESLMSAGNISVASVISGAGNLVIHAAGSVTLSGTNTYTGATSVTSGTLIISNVKAIQNSASLTVASNSTLTLSGVAVTALEAPATFNLNGTVTSTGASSYAGAITLASNSIFSVASSTTLTLSGAIDGSGSLTMSGPGTLVLTGTNNSYTGETILNGGTTSIAADLSLGAAPVSVDATSLTFNGGTLVSTATFTLNANRGITLTGNGTIDPATATTLSYAGIIAGNGSLTMNGAGTLSLTGVNTYTGGTVLDAGTVSIAADSGLGAIPASFSATNLIFNGSTLATTATITLNANRGVTLSGAATFTPASSTTLTINGVITGSGLLTMNGAGTFALPATNTNTGGVTINNASGIVNATNVNSLGTSGTITVTAGTLSLNLGGATLTNTNTINLNGAGVGSEGALFEAGMSGTDIVNNPINLVSATGIGIANGGTLELGASGNPVISGTGALTINQSGTTGELIINSTANTYTGVTTIDAGTVTIGLLKSLSTASSLGAPTTAANGTITLGSGVTLIDEDLSANAASNRNITTTGSGSESIVAWNGTGALSLTGAITNSGSGGLLIETSNTGTLALATGAIINTTGLTFATLTSAGNISAANVISGAGNLTINANTNGSVTLSGANTFTGSMTVQNGTVIITNARAFQNAISLTVDDGTTIILSSVAITAASSPTTFSLQGTGVGGNGVLIGQGTSSYAGSITLTANSTFAVQSGNTLTLSGAIGGASVLTLAGPGTLALTGTNNSYSGGTVVAGGTLSAAADLSLGAAPNSFSATNLTLSGGNFATTATFTLNANRGIALVSNAEIDPAATKILSYAGVISGSGALTMNGAGTLSLSGVNTYTGGTIFAAGTMSVASDSNLGAIPNSFTATNLMFNGGDLASTANIALNANRGITITGNAIFTPATGTTLTVNGIITGGGLLTMNGPGTLSLTAANTNTGGVTVNNANGTVSASNVGALGTSGNITLTAGSLLLNIAGTLTNQSILTMNNGTTLNGVGNTTLQNAISFGGTAAARTITTTNSTDIFTLNGAINGAAALTLNGAGTIVLTGAVGNSTPLTSVTSNAGSTVQVNGGSITTAGSQTYNGIISLVSDTTFTTTAAGSSFSLTNAANNFTAVPTFATSGAGALTTVSLRNASTSPAFPVFDTMPTNLILNFSNAAITLPGLTITGTLTITAGGAITQQAPYTSADALIISGTGTSTFTTGNFAITLTNPNNQLNANVSANGNPFNAGVFVHDNGSAINSTIAVNNTGNNNVTVVTQGMLVMGNSTVGSGILSLSGTNGVMEIYGANQSITTAANAVGIILNGNTGPVMFESDTGNHLNGPVAIITTNTTTGTISPNTGATINIVNNAVALVLGSVNGTATNTGSDLLVSAHGSISQNAALTINGNLTVGATAANTDILLNSFANSFTSLTFGPFSNTSGVNLADIRDVMIEGIDSNSAPTSYSGLTNLRNVTLNFTNGTLSLPSMSLSGTLTLMGSVPVTQQAGTTLTANTLTANTSSTISLTNSGNNIANIGAMTTVGGLTLNDTAATVTGALTDSTGAISLTTTGALIIDQPMTTNNQPIVLTASSIELGSTITTQGGTATFMGPVTLVGNSSVDTENGNITFNNTLQGNFGLTLNAGSLGNILFSSNVNIGALTIQNVNIFNNNATTNVTSFTQNAGAVDNLGDTLIVTNGNANIHVILINGDLVVTNGNATITATNVNMNIVATGYVTITANTLYGTVNVGGLTLDITGAMQLSGSVGGATGAAALAKIIFVVPPAGLQFFDGIDLHYFVEPASAATAAAIVNAQNILPPSTSYTSFADIDLGEPVIQINNNSAILSPALTFISSLVAYQTVVNNLQYNLLYSGASFMNWSRGGNLAFENSRLFGLLRNVALLPETVIGRVGAALLALIMLMTACVRWLRDLILHHRFLEDDFVPSLSFNLRTQLNNILGFAGLIYSEQLCPISLVQKEYMSDILESTKQLQEFVTQKIECHPHLPVDELATISFELRTTLNNVMGFSDLIRTGKVGVVTPELDEYLSYIKTSSGEMMQMAETIR